MKSIRHQLTRQLVVSIVGLLGIGLAVVYFAVRHELLEAVDATLRARALAVASLSEIEQGRVQFDFSPEFLASYPASRPQHYFEVFDGKGNSLVRSPSLGRDDLSWRSGGTGERPKYYNLPLPHGRAGRAAALMLSVVSAEHKAGLAATMPLQIVVATDRGELGENLARILAVILGCGALLVAAIFWLVPRVLTHGLSSLEDLGVQAEKIDSGSLDVRFPAASLPIELQPIASRLNDLLSRLEASFERERRFSADLAHELRTPVAELRTLAECALKWPGHRDPSADADVLAIADHLEALVTRMLALTRGERGQVTAQLTSLDLAALVADAWQPFAVRAAARGLRPVFALPAVTVEADPVLLRAALANLFDNAVDYAPADSEIRITAASTAKGCTLHIANRADDLSPEEVGRCFDRFWRKEAARSGGVHLGLGLNLARMFVTAMGWTLGVERDPAGWIVFTLATASQKS